MKIVLPWPHKDLSPNARKHWGAVKDIKAGARKEAWALTVGAMARDSIGKRHFEGDGKIPYRVTFYPPDNRHRDDDNQIAAFKSARDGIADAIGVNDRRFAPHYFFEDCDGTGRVEVCLG